MDNSIIEAIVARYPIRNENLVDPEPFIDALVGRHQGLKIFRDIIIRLNYNAKKFWQDLMSPFTFAENVDEDFLRMCMPYLKAMVWAYSTKSYPARALHTAFHFMSKVPYGFPNDVVKTATEEYIRWDNSLPTAEQFYARLLDYGFSPRFNDYLRGFLTEIFGSNQPKIVVDDDFIDYEISGHHGPGATWQGSTYPEKWHGLKKIRKVRGILYAPWMEEDTNDIPRARLVLVEKDSFRPRTITTYSAPHAYNAQGARNILVSAARRSKFWRQINIFDQYRQRLAVVNSYSSSEGRFSLSTIDLSNASDSLSIFHLREFYPTWVQEMVRCVRASELLVEHPVEGLTKPFDGKLFAYTTKKIDGMGLAPIFILQTAFFFAVCAAVVRHDYGKSQSLYNDLISQIGAYGDDIVVPSRIAKRVIDALEALGFKVNRAKSFGRNSYQLRDGEVNVNFHLAFRETCGLDIANGYVVTPVRRRFAHINITDRKLDNPEVWLSANAEASHAYWMGLKGLYFAFENHILSPIRKATGLAMPLSLTPGYGVPGPSGVLNVKRLIFSLNDPNDGEIVSSLPVIGELRYAASGVIKVPNRRYFEALEELRQYLFNAEEKLRELEPKIGLERAVDLIKRRARALENYVGSLDPFVELDIDNVRLENAWYTSARTVIPAMVDEKWPEEEQESEVQCPRLSAALSSQAYRSTRVSVGWKMGRSAKYVRAIQNADSLNQSAKEVLSLLLLVDQLNQIS